MGRSSYHPKAGIGVGLRVLLGLCLLAGAGVTLAGWAASLAGAAPLAGHVVIVSIDGLRPDALLQAATPHLDSLWKSGAYTWRAQTVRPSITLPAHASMLSGVEPRRHGVLWNQRDPARGYIRVPTVFDVLRQAGMRGAMFVGKDKLLHLARPDLLDRQEVAGPTAAEVVRKAVVYLAGGRPVLTFLHLPDLDGTGHLLGWMSKEQLRSLEQVDRAIGSLLEGLRQAQMWPAIMVIVSADHGGHGFDHNSADPLDTTIPWFAHGQAVRVAYEIGRPVRITDTAPTALHALGLPIPGGWDGVPLLEIFRTK